MTLSERLAEYVRACFSGLWLQSHEHDDAIQEIARLCRDRNWSFASWDVDRGLGRTGGAAEAALAGTADPLAAIRAAGSIAPDDGAAVLVLRNFHRFLGSAEIVQAIDTQLAAGKQNRTTLIILSPVVQIPPELERQFTVVEHELPGRDQLEAIARAIATEPGELPEGEGLSAALDAAAGMTRMEAENAFSLALVRETRLAPHVIWELKTQGLKKSGLLELHRGGESFADLGASRLSNSSAPGRCDDDRPGRARVACCSWAFPGRESRRSRKPSGTSWACPRSSSTWGA